MRIKLDIDGGTYRSLGIGYLLVLLVAASLGILTGASLAVTGAVIVVGLVLLPALCVPLFVSVLLHELGHVVAAIGLGLRVRAIKVYGVYFLFGGAPMPEGARSSGFADLKTQLRRDQPWSATLISLAGPAVDIAVALGCYLLLRNSPEPIPWGRFYGFLELRPLGTRSRR
ncbi:hypothetical protein EON82_07780 [bacterium]|nr:MAG: hypothetical protein EON82_07780 [bacterium]